MTTISICAETIFGSATNFCLRYASAKLEKLTFCSAYIYFGTAILKFNSFSFVPYCTYTNRADESLFLSFCTIGISMYSSKSTRGQYKTLI